MIDISRRSPDLRAASIPNPPLRVAALVGSLRHASLNRALLEAAREVAPLGLVIEPVEIGDLPFYDADLEARGDPPPVRRLKTQHRRSCVRHGAGAPQRGRWSFGDRRGRDVTGPARRDVVLIDRAGETST